MQLTASGPPGPKHVFISYSRLQFYFAESLALHLQRNGISAWLDVQRLEAGADWAKGIEAGLTGSASVLLVASRDSLSSEYVKKEWKAALRAGKPVNVAMFETIELPSELDDASISLIDFRGNFQVALDKLITCIRSGVVHRDPVPRSDIPSILRPVPREVALLALQLLLAPLLVLVFLITTIVMNSPALVTLKGVELENNVVVITMFGAIFGSLSLWGLYTWWTFVHRRFNYRDVQQISLGGPLPLLGIVWFFSPMRFKFWSLPRPLWSVMTALAVGLVVLGLYNYFWTIRNSSDLFRWLPTGEAPQEFRLKQLKSLQRLEKASTTTFLKAKRYKLHYEPADSNIADKVDGYLRVFGQTISSSLDSTHELASAPSRRECIQACPDEELQIVILSNKTLKTRVESILAKHAKVIAVVASNIQIPGDISEIARYQWIDYRNQSDERLRILVHHIRGGDLGDTTYALNAVPESLQRPVIPIKLAVLIKFVQGLAGYNIGIAGIELTVKLVNQRSAAASTLAISVLVAAGLMQFVAVGTVLARQVTTKILSIMVIASLALMAASGEFAVTRLLFPCLVLVFFCRRSSPWLPTIFSQQKAEPTFGLPEYKLWLPHLLFVTAIVLYYLLPFGLTAIVTH